jgi:hypothetical protein
VPFGSLSALFSLFCTAFGCISTALGAGIHQRVGFAATSAEI